MSQWFRGKIEGTYVGVPAKGTFSSSAKSATRYKMRVYRALVRDIELIESSGEDGEETPEVPEEVASCSDALYQATVDQVRLIGLPEHPCLEGAIYEVAITNWRISHSAQKDGKTYGRVLGDVYGKFLAPEPEDPPVEEALVASESEEPRSEPQPMTASGSSKEEAEEQGSKEETKAPEKRASRKKASERKEPEGADEPPPQESDIKPLHPPSRATKYEDEFPSDGPLALLGIALTILLALTGGFGPALLWVGIMVPLVFIRLMLRGQFHVTAPQKVVAAILVCIHVGCLGVMGLDWLASGCLSLNIWAVSGMAFTVLAASILPSPSALMVTGTGLGTFLLLLYGGFGVTCTEKHADDQAQVDTAPSVHHPGTPRTNDDGSWPRKPSSR